MIRITESKVKSATPKWLESLGWSTAYSPDIAPGMLGEERTDYAAMVLERRLRDALARLNPDLPFAALDGAVRKLISPEGATPKARNRIVHKLRVNGATEPPECLTWKITP